jgi:hypothetical protein
MDRSQKAAMAQISAMESEMFEIGLFTVEPQPSMIVRAWDGETLIRSMGWVKHQNGSGRNIYVRPAGEHRLTLVDDLTADAVATMKKSGFQPAVVVETSPGNYQAWLKHAEVLPKAVGSAAARTLAEKFGGDTGAADWRHFGRLAGFTNRKAKYMDVQTGLYPFVRLVEAPGQVYAKAGEFLRDLHLRMEREAAERRRTSELWANAPSNAPAKTIDAFRGDSKYLGDNTRIDLAYAIYALSHGSSENDVAAALKSRDLSHKGNESRQHQYVERTIHKALRGIDGPGRNL